MNRCLILIPIFKIGSQHYTYVYALFNSFGKYETCKNVIREEFQTLLLFNFIT